MSIQRVIANKRCLMISSYELDDIYIALRDYDPYVGKGGDLTTVGYTYKTIYSNGTDNTNQTLVGLSILKTKEEIAGIWVLKGKMIYNNEDIIYNYDNNKYVLRVITSVLDNNLLNKLSQYFTGKKVFKIINIYIGSRETINNKYNIKIYYLEKK